MASPYDPILTSAGLLKNGELTKSAKNRYIDEVSALLLTGNSNGKGGSPTTKIFNSLVPIPPIPGPSIVNLTTLSEENLFWFESDPAAALISQLLKDENNNPFWHKIFIGALYEPTAVALDINGTTPLFPVFDPSAAFNVDIPLPFELQDLALKLKLQPPELAIKLADLGIDVKFPSVPSPPLFSMPKIDVNANVQLPNFVLNDLMTGLIKLPFDLILNFIVPPSLDLVLDLHGLPLKVFNLAIDIVLKLLINLGLIAIVPKVFVASLLIYIKNIVAMVSTIIVGLLVGSGNISKSVATLTGLV